MDVAAGKTLCPLPVLVISLALLACQSSQDESLGGDRSDDGFEASQAASIAQDLNAQTEESEFARHAAARALVDEQYELIQDWLRQHDLLRSSHAELMSLAATDTAAARYIECHDSSRSPTGENTRLGLLSTCLTQEVPGDGVIATDPQSVAAVDQPAPQH